MKYIIFKTRIEVVNGQYETKKTIAYTVINDYDHALNVLYAINKKSQDIYQMESVGL